MRLGKEPATLAALKKNCTYLASISSPCLASDALMCRV